MRRIVFFLSVIPHFTQPVYVHTNDLGWRLFIADTVLYVRQVSLTIKYVTLIMMDDFESKKILYVVNFIYKQTLHHSIARIH